MIDIVKYKGYYGVVDYCQEDNLFFVIVAGIGNSSISCHGDTLDEAKKEYTISIDYYLEVCEAEGWTPCTTDPKVAREMEALLGKNDEGDFHIIENRRSLAFAQ